MLKIVWLYWKSMNIYGDYGNILALEKQLKIHGLKYQIIRYDIGDKFPEDADIVIGGGGQDSSQNKIQDDLMAIAPKLIELAKKGVPMLMICGMYQLFGRFFRTLKGEEILGANILPIETIAGEERMIGNIIIKSQEFGEIIGYENHSGQTFLDKTVTPLGQVIKGAGNNMIDANEGVRYNNVIATYLHGPVLPKNPQIADFLINEALNRRGISIDPETDKIDDSIANEAREISLKLPR